MKWPEDFINKVICGDCLDVMKHIPDNAVDLVIIDPPYSGLQVKSKSGTRLRQEKCHTEFSDMSERAFLLFMKPILRELYRILKLGNHFYCFTDWKQLRNMMDCIELASFKLINLICWDKCSFGLGAGYRPQTEYILLFSKGIAKNFNYKNIGNIIHCKRAKSNFHPHEKPIKLIDILIKNSTVKNDIIVDCMAGSGVVGISAIAQSRQFIISEINPDYCKIAEQRLAQEVMEL